MKQNIMTSLEPAIHTDNLLQFGKITLKEDYRKKWNVDSNDFVCLTKNGKLINDSIFKIGGLNTPKLNHDRYFMLIKYVEAFYPKHMIAMTKSDPKHLEGRWCIFDKNGIEKVEFKTYEHPYIIKNSCIYSINSQYFNIETGECYGTAYTSIQSEDFLFLDNQFDKDESKRGVLKIDKLTGKYELFKS